MCSWCECTYERAEDLERCQRIKVGSQPRLGVELPAHANFSGEGEYVDVGGLPGFGSVDNLDFVCSQILADPGVA